MDYVPLVLIALIGGSAIGVCAVILRTPLKLLSHGTRITELETEVAHLSTQVKKALRRIGIEEKKARATEQPPDEQPGLPFPPTDDEENGLDYAARLAAISRAGRLVRRRKA